MSSSCSVHKLLSHLFILPVLLPGLLLGLLPDLLSTVHPDLLSTTDLLIVILPVLFIFFRDDTLVMVDALLSLDVLLFHVLGGPTG